MAEVYAVGRGPDYHGSSRSRLHLSPGDMRLVGYKANINRLEIWRMDRGMIVTSDIKDAFPYAFVRCRVKMADMLKVAEVEGGEWPLVLVDRVGF